jgi:EpsI family protein
MTPRIGLAVSAVIIILTSMYVNVFLGKSEARVARESLSTFPKVVGKWSGDDQLFTTSDLMNLGVDEYLMRRFSDGKESIWLYIGYYKSQKEGAVPHSPRHCYPGSGFNPIKVDKVTIPVVYPGKREIRPNRYVFAKGSEREVVIYWYQSRGRVIANEYEEKFYLIWDSIFRNRSDGALVRFSTRATVETEEVASKQLGTFVSQIYPFISRVVPD